MELLLMTLQQLFHSLVQVRDLGTRVIHLHLFRLEFESEWVIAEEELVGTLFIWSEVCEFRLGKSTTRPW